MFEEITLEYIKQHEFRLSCSEIDEKEEKVAYRFSKGDYIPPATDEKLSELKVELTELYYQKFKGDYKDLETKCAINKDSLLKFTLNKASSKRGRNNVGRNALAKICVGAGLSVEEAQKLFILQGFALDPVNNRFDAIVVCCLKNHYDIYELISMCQEYKIPLDRSISLE